MAAQRSSFQGILPQSAVGFGEALHALADQVAFNDVGMGDNSGAAALQLQLFADNGCCMCSLDKSQPCRHTADYHALVNAPQLKMIVQALLASARDPSGGRTHAACRALHQLATVCERVNEALTTMQAVEAAAGLLEACPASGWVRVWTWAGLCMAVVRAMAFATQPHACHRACLALAMLADRHAGCQTVLGAEGACQTLMAGGLRTFPSHRLVCLTWCQAVKALAMGRTDHQQALGELGACQEGVRVIETFPDDEPLRFWACALAAHATDHAGNMRTPTVVSAASKSSAVRQVSEKLGGLCDVT